MSSHFSDVLAEHSFFKGLPAPMLECLVADATEARFEAREIVVRAGDAAREFHLIRSGKVAIEIFTPEHGPVVIQTLGEGELLGWSWLVEPYAWNFDAEAIETTEVLKFNAERIRDTWEGDPQFGYQLLRRFVPLIVQRLQSTRMQLLDVYHAPG